MARSKDWIRWPKYIGKGARQYKRRTPLDPEQPNWTYCHYGRETKKVEWTVTIEAVMDEDEVDWDSWTLGVVAYHIESVITPWGRSKEVFRGELGEYPTQREALEAFAAMLKL